MSNIAELVSLCKASVDIQINAHKDYYETAKQWFEDIDKFEKEDIPEGVLEEIIESNTIVRIQAYPHTPIGSYVVYHYDVDDAIDIMLKTIKEG